MSLRAAEAATAIEDGDHNSGGDDDEDAPCEVCGVKESFAEDQILFCDGCNVAVHQECYAIKRVPRGEWRCRPCEARIPAPTCRLCNKRGGAMMPCAESSKHWVHSLCFMSMPECFTIANTGHDDGGGSGRGGSVNEKVLVAGCQSAIKKRRSLRCVICGVGRGACIQCVSGRCCVAAHPMCARLDKRWLSMELNDHSMMGYHCPTHNRSHKKKSKKKKRKDAGERGSESSKEGRKKSKKRKRRAHKTRDVEQEISGTRDIGLGSKRRRRRRTVTGDESPDDSDYDPRGDVSSSSDEDYDSDEDDDSWADDSDDDGNGFGAGAADDVAVHIARLGSEGAAALRAESRARRRLLASDGAVGAMRVRAWEHALTVAEKATTAVDAHQLAPLCDKVAAYVGRPEGEGGTMSCAVVHGYAAFYGRAALAGALVTRLRRENHCVAVLRPALARSTHAAMRAVVNQLADPDGEGAGAGGDGDGGSDDEDEGDEDVEGGGVEITEVAARGPPRSVGTGAGLRMGTRGGDDATLRDRRKERRAKAALKREVGLAPMMALSNFLAEKRCHERPKVGAEIIDSDTGGVAGSTPSGRPGTANAPPHITVILERVEAYDPAVINKLIHALSLRHDAREARVSFVVCIASHPHALQAIIGQREASFLQAWIFPLPPAAGALNALVGRLFHGTGNPGTDADAFDILPIDVDHATAQAIVADFDAGQLSLQALPLRHLLLQHFVQANTSSRLAMLAVPDVSSADTRGPLTEDECVRLCEALPDDCVDTARSLPSVAAACTSGGGSRSLASPQERLQDEQRHPLPPDRAQLGRWMYDVLRHRRARRVGIALLKALLDEARLQLHESELFIACADPSAAALRDIVSRCSIAWTAANFRRVLSAWRHVVESSRGGSESDILGPRVADVAVKLDAASADLEQRTADAAAAAAQPGTHIPFSTGRGVRGMRPSQPRPGAARRRREALQGSMGGQVEVLGNVRRFLGESLKSLLQPLGTWLPLHEPFLFARSGSLSNSTSPPYVDHIRRALKSKEHATSDAAAAFKHFSSASTGRLINLADWLEDFALNLPEKDRGLVGGSYDNESEEDESDRIVVSRDVMDRFLQVVRDFEVMGLVRPTSKRADHVEKLDLY